MCSTGSPGPGVFWRGCGAGEDFTYFFEAVLTADEVPREAAACDDVARAVRAGSFRLSRHIGRSGDGELAASVCLRYGT